METIKREPLIISTGHKGIGKSYFIEDKYKDYFKVETHNKNRQDKSILYRILDAKKIHEKVTLKTHVNFVKNKYNMSEIRKCKIDFTVLLEDIGNDLINNKKRVKHNINKFYLKDMEVYNLIKNGK